MSVRNSQGKMNDEKGFYASNQVCTKFLNINILFLHSIMKHYDIKPTKFHKKEGFALWDEKDIEKLRNITEKYICLNRVCKAFPQKNRADIQRFFDENEVHMLPAGAHTYVLREILPELLEFHQRKKLIRNNGALITRFAAKTGVNYFKLRDFLEANEYTKKALEECSDVYKMPFTLIKELEDSGLLDGKSTNFEALNEHFNKKLKEEELV